MVDFAKIMADRRAQRGTSLTSGTTMVPQTGIGALPDAMVAAAPAAASTPAAGGAFGRFRAAPQHVEHRPAEASGAAEPPAHVPEEVPAEPVEAVAPPPAPRISPFATAASAIALRERTEPQALPGGDDATPREYAAPKGGFSRFGVDPATLPAAEARRDVHAVKVVTKLVAGIAFEPGSKASPAQKVEALRARMDEMQRAAGELADLVSPDHVTGWVRAQCCEAVADMIGKRCERVGAFQDVTAAVRAVGETIAQAGLDERVAEIVDGLADSKYRTADDRETAQARLMVSTASAVWDTYDRVTAATVLGRPYTFERSALEIAEALVGSVHEVASSLAIEVPDVDMQVAHLQGSIRRIATLISAEYCAQILRADDFIRQAAGPEQEARLAALTKRADAIIADSIRVGTDNFRAVEGVAPRLLEQSLAREHARVNEVAR
jgi:hypothetical protein